MRAATPSKPRVTKRASAKKSAAVPSTPVLETSHAHGLSFKNLLRNAREDAFNADLRKLGPNYTEVQFMDTVMRCEMLDIPKRLYAADRLMQHSKNDSATKTATELAAEIRAALQEIDATIGSAR